MLRLVRNPPLEPGLVDALVDIWTAVSNAGGAVGFLPGVTAAEVRPVAEEALAAVADGRHDLVVAVEDHRPVGFGFLETRIGPLFTHVGTVKRLQRDPRHRGRGVGAAVLGEIEAAALARGMALVTLTVRGGTGRERYYIALGYRIDGRLPDRIQVGEDRFVEEIVMSKWLTGSPAPAVATLPVQRLDAGLALPGYAHPGDAGLDLCAASDVELEPGARAVIGTGVAVAVPEGCVGLVHPRSGLAARHGLGLVNAPGTVDAGYRGEIKVILVNLDRSEPIRIQRGQRVAQLVVQRVEQVTVEEVDELPQSARGEGGLGSTGL